MSYTVLARKWRPRRFEELVGQPHVVQALANSLADNRLHHAYLFTGTRGIGKTTVARLLAKALNCETGIVAEPCGVCAACTAIDAGRFVDLIEVDAASRTKVDDTRELLDNVQYAPTRGRFKVYLIDEVHMLSNHSFNALLKTLEEPPPHVKFLLATTDPQKLPVTVLSRCLQFNLKRFTVAQIQAQLEKICSAEGIAFDAAGLKAIARAAAGSMRDGTEPVGSEHRVRRRKGRRPVGRCHARHHRSRPRAATAGRVGEARRIRACWPRSKSSTRARPTTARCSTSCSRRCSASPCCSSSAGVPTTKSSRAVAPFAEQFSPEDVAAVLSDRAARPPGSADRARAANGLRDDVAADARVSAVRGGGRCARHRARARRDEDARAGGVAPSRARGCGSAAARVGRRSCGRCRREAGRRGRCVCGVGRHRAYARSARAGATTRRQLRLEVECRAARGSSSSRPTRST